MKSAALNCRTGNAPRSRLASFLKLTYCAKALQYAGSLTKKIRTYANFIVKLHHSSDFCLTGYDRSGLIAFGRRMCPQPAARTYWD
ncbi:hypothetical protein SAMN05421663_11190 [Terribacillus halophilus]|uniref:Uncharacterized protein n=1 Tax=Terribacillus halophilus TaxID=361279 RepID=A0A1G6V228_9BACI|nr:hypothetical protein SAMN05421663_11190 [Terribacillus halophilus]